MLICVQDNHRQGPVTGRKQEKAMFKKILITLFVAGLVAIVLTGCGDLPKSAVAEVNGKVITREDLDRNIEDLKVQYQNQGGFPESGTPEYTEMQKQVAERLVNEEILWFEADKLNIKVTDQEINDQLDTYKQQAGGDEQFQSQLKEKNYTEDRLKDQIRKSLLFQKLYPEVTKDAAAVTDEQALKYFNENPTLFQQAETRTVRHILVKDEATANQVEARLAAGEDFATLAKELSTDPGSKDKGGELGSKPTTGSGFVPEFEAGMAALTVGQISAPVKTSFGFHIIQVTAITPPGTQTFDQVKEELKQGLATENQRTAFEAWFDSVKGNYDVTYNEEFKPTPTTPTTATGDSQTTQTQAVPVQ
ncbi:MAG: peptidyl-prolyl cis-trans isomerase [Thermoleophilia bacterium]